MSSDSTEAAAAATSQPCSCSPSVPLSEEWAAEAAQRAADQEEEEDEEDEEEETPADSSVSSRWSELLGGASKSGASAAPAPPPPALTFEYQRHVAFFSMHLRSIPQGYEGMDTSRMTLLYFCLSALDVLGALDSAVMSKGLAPGIIEWIYAQQVHPRTDPATGEVDVDGCGFRGGPSGGVPFEPNRTEGHPASAFPSDHAHIAMTYTALCCLRILGDTSFSRVNRGAVVGALRNLQQADGSFSSTRLRSESDMRFLYCACVISALLCDWSGFDVPRSARFIARSQSYDGGVGLWGGCEGHGGSTYCALASLSLMGSLGDTLPDIDRLLKWLVCNQGSGYRGRPNKPEDCCYSFWTAASLAIVGAELGLEEELGPSRREGGGEGGHSASWLQGAANREFNLRCQHRMGGFAKEPGPGRYPDLLHAYFGVVGLSLIGLDAQLLQYDVLIGLTKRAAGTGKDAHIKRDGSTW